jgi:hypothetical protein
MDKILRLDFVENSDLLLIVCIIFGILISANFHPMAVVEDTLIIGNQLGFTGIYALSEPEQIDIDINRKTQALQIPLLPPIHPWGNSNLLIKDHVGEFEKRIGIPVNPGHDSGMGPAVEPEIIGGPEYGYQKSHLSNGYIWSKIEKGNPTKHLGNARVNGAIDRIKTEIKDDKRKGANDVIQDALKQ